MASLDQSTSKAEGKAKSISHVDSVARSPLTVWKDNMLDRQLPALKTDMAKFSALVVDPDMPSSYAFSF